MQYGEVCIGDAVNWDSSLNRGLVSWWVSLPGQQRGVMLRDLCMRNHGTLTGGPVWEGGRGRPGGYGTLRIAPMAHTNVPDADSLTPPAIAVFAWVRVDAISGFQAIVTKENSFVWWVGSSGKMRYDLNNGSWNGQRDGAATLSAGAWYHVGLTFDGTNRKLWVNGVEDDSAAMTGSLNNSTNPLQFGMLNSTSDGLTGNIDDVRLHSTVPSVSSLYNDSRRGYPNALNWTQRRPRYAPEQAAAGGYIDNTHWILRNILGRAG